MHYDTAMWECFNFLFKVFVVFEHVLIREGAYPPALLLTTAALGAVVMQRYAHVVSTHIMYILPFVSSSDMFLQIVHCKTH